MDSSKITKAVVLRAWRPWLGTFLLLLGLSLAATSYWQASRMERLFHANFEALPQLAVAEKARVLDQVATTSSSQAIYQQALQYQEARQYRFALTAWRAYFLAEEKEVVPYAFLYAALAAHAEGDSKEAAYFLEQLPPGYLATPFGEQLQWYRALTALRQQDKGQAMALLQQLSQQPLTHYGSDRAPRLLATLAASSSED